MSDSENRLLWTLKILTVLIVVCFWAALQNAQDFWPLTRWRMYAVGVFRFPPYTQEGYQIDVTLADGSVRSLFSSDLFYLEEQSLQESTVIDHIFDDSDIYLREDYRFLLMERLRRALPDADIAWIDIWKMTWLVRRWEIPSVDRANPLESSLELSMPGDYYFVTRPQVSTVWLEFGDSLGLLDHRILNDTSQIAACETLFVHTGWRALQPPTTDYHITVVLVGPDNLGIVQDDGPLAITRTRDWQTGEEHLDRRSLALPCDLTPGIYRVLVGVYDLETVQNLPIRYPGGPFYTTLAIVDEINISGAES